VLHQNGRDIRTIRIAEMPRASVDTVALDQYVGWYQINPYRVITVSLNGDRLRAQETGRAAFDLAADGVDAFANGSNDLLVFLRDDQGRVTRMLHQNVIGGARLASKTNETTAQSIEASFARRIAQVPDRFREQIPAPGGREAILHGIDDLR